MAGSRELVLRRLCNAATKLSKLSWSLSILWISKLAAGEARKQALAALALTLRLEAFRTALLLVLAPLCKSHCDIEVKRPKISLTWRLLWIFQLRP